jgi:phosphate starvation-inducible PhoH-like protein
LYAKFLFVILEQKYWCKFYKTDNLTEKLITIENVEPQRIYGSNNRIFNLIKDFYPELSIIGRGNEFKIKGNATEVENFAEKFAFFTNLISKGNVLTDYHVKEIFERQVDAKDNTPSEIKHSKPLVILYGNDAKPILAKTKNQQEMVECIEKNDVVFAIGPAGSGKTYTAVALAVRELKNKEVKKIILTRPAVEAGESLGFLPGDLKEKIDPYLRPLYDALEDMIPPEKLKAFLENGTIEIAPLAFMRGRTLNNCFVILDEAQNTTDLQLKMFLTRMGLHAKVVVTGDLTQIDLPQKQKSGLHRAIHILSNIPGLKIIKLSNKDVLRHRLVIEILKAYDKEGVGE